MKRTAILLSLVAIFAAGCQQSQGTSATAGSAAPASAKTSGGTRAKALGAWTAADGDKIELTDDVLTHDFKSTGGSKMRFPYKVVEDTPEHLVISTQIDLGGGKLLPANTQIITVSGDTLVMKSKEGGGATTFKRAK